MGKAKPPRFGRIPMSDAFNPDGSPNEAVMPEFIAVWNSDGTAIAGYIARDDLFVDGSGREHDGPSDPAAAVRMMGTSRVDRVLANRKRVVDEQQRTVGWWYDEIGFVSVGEHARPDFSLEDRLPPENG